MRRLVIILRVLMCVVIALTTVECLARLDDRITHGAPFLAPYNELTIYDYDELGRIGKPNGQYLKWRLNSIGYRGPELHDGRIRIACIGSSETFGVYESDNNEYPRQLERQLNHRAGGPVFEVINAAYPGMTVRTADLRVKYLVERVHPRLALIYPNFANYIWVPWLKNTAPPPKTPEFELRIASRLENSIAKLVPEGLKQWRREISIQRAAGAYTVMPSIPDGNIELFVVDLEQLVRDLRSQGVAPVLMTHASRFQEPVTGTERYHLSQWRIYFPMLEESGFLDMERRMNVAVRDVAARNGVQLIDIDREMPRGPKYFGDFVHFTDAGAFEMSRIIVTNLSPEQLE